MVYPFAAKFLRFANFLYGCDFMKKNLVRYVAMLCAILLILFSFVSCNDDTMTNETEPTTTTEPVVIKTDYNRLTGLDNLSEQAKGKRPVAIMINNIKASLPQYGISQADLMFECLVEGGITRMMAVYADYTKIPSVCSVRSCRYYYPILAQGLDAVYICFGSNETLGTPTLKRLGIDYFNGAEKFDEQLFGRDANRLGKYSREHTAYVKGENIPEVLETNGVRTDYLESKDDYIFNFREPGEFKKTSKTACDKVKLSFSNAYYSTFTYDSEKKVYLKQHSGNAHMDTSSGEQLSYTNVFVLETDVSLYGNGPLVQMDWKGGTGYYITANSARKITWTKKSENSNIKIKDAETGKSVKVNPGKSYIGIIDYGKTTLTSQGANVVFASSSSTSTQS